MKQEETCQCGHSREAHEHYRSGSDCSLCPETCKRFTPAKPDPPEPTAIRRLRRDLRVI